MSPMTVSDVLTEVWVVSPETPSEVWCNGEFVAAVRTLEKLSPTMSRWEGDRVRAQIVQCAPEALLLLDHVAHAFEAETELTVTGPKAAELYDRISALLKKAGLR